MIGTFDINAARFRVGSPEELNAVGLRRTRVVRHPPSWQAAEVVEGRLVDVPRWGIVDISVTIATNAIGLTLFSCHLSEPEGAPRPEIEWNDVRQRLAGEAMVGTSLIVREGLTVFGRPEVFRAVTTIEMMCPTILTAEELDELDQATG
jgi:hypothetical protein